MATGMKGASLTVEVADSDSPGEFVPVANGTTYDRQRTRQTTQIPVFGDPEAITLSSTRSTSLQLEFVRKKGDEGQAVVLAAAEAEESVMFRIMYDEDEGYTQEFQINDDGESADPAEAQRITFSLSPVGDRTAVES